MKDDEGFVDATRFTTVADRHGIVLVAPEQMRRHQANRCWRWYEARNQQRGLGEPALLSGVVTDMADERERWRIDPRSLAELPALQARLLESAAPLARRRIVYGTCTIHRAENEEVAGAFDRAHPEFRRAATWRTLPHVEGTDGFFAAVWDRR